MKENQEVFLKVKGEILICPYLTTCDVCHKWIEKGEAFGHATLGDWDYNDVYEIKNCLTCLKEKT